jgi:maleate isomerase
MAVDEVARLRIGLLIPSSNRMTEDQFHRLAPPGVYVHVQRARITGPWHRPLPEMEPALREAAAVLGDARPDVVVFHCTLTSMESGAAGEARIREVVGAEVGCPVITTASAVLDALAAVGARRLAVYTPYTDEANVDERLFLEAAGYGVAAIHGMGLTRSDDYLRVTGAEWRRYVLERHDASADACFLSCTNTQAIDVAAQLEADLGRPVVTSNQAVLWACLPPPLREAVRVPLGRLFRAVA